MNEMQIKWDSPTAGAIEKPVREVVLYTELNRLPLLFVCVDTAEDPTEAETFDLEGVGSAAAPATKWYPLTVEWVSADQRALLVLSPLSTARIMAPMVENDLNIKTVGRMLSAFVPGEKGTISNGLQAGGAFDKPLPWALSVNEGAETWLRRLSAAAKGVWTIAPKEDGSWSFFDVSETTPPDDLEMPSDWSQEGTQRVLSSASFDLSGESEANVAELQATTVCRFEKSAYDPANPFAWAGQWEQESTSSSQDRNRIVASFHVLHTAQSAAVWDCQAWSMPEAVASDTAQLARVLQELGPLRRWISRWQHRLQLGQMLEALPLVLPAVTWMSAIPAQVVETVEPALQPTDPQGRQVYKRNIAVKFPWAKDKTFHLPLILPMNGNDGTAFFAPAIDDHIFVHFAAGNPSRPMATWSGRLTSLAQDEERSEAADNSSFVAGTSITNGTAAFYHIPPAALKGTVRGIQTAGPLVLRGSSVIIEADSFITISPSVTTIVPPKDLGGKYSIGSQWWDVPGDLVAQTSRTYTLRQSTDSVTRNIEFTNSKNYMKSSRSDTILTDSAYSQTRVVDAIQTKLTTLPDLSKDKTDMSNSYFEYGFPGTPPYYNSEQTIDKGGIRTSTSGLTRLTTNEWLVELVNTSRFLKIESAYQALTLDLRTTALAVTAEWNPVKILFQFLTQYDITFAGNTGQPGTPDPLKVADGVATRETAWTKATAAHVISIMYGYRVTHQVLVEGGPVWIYGHASRYGVGNYTDVVYGERRESTAKKRMSIVGGEAQFLYISDVNAVYESKLNIHANEINEATLTKKESYSKLTTETDRSEARIATMKNWIDNSTIQLKNAAAKAKVATYDEDTKSYKASTVLDECSVFQAKRKMALHSSDYLIYN